MFPCCKGHFIRAYLDTTWMTLVSTSNHLFPLAFNHSNLSDQIGTSSNKLRNTKPRNVRKVTQFMAWHFNILLWTGGIHSLLRVDELKRYMLTITKREIWEKWPNLRHFKILLWRGYLLQKLLQIADCPAMHSYSAEMFSTMMPLQA